MKNIEKLHHLEEVGPSQWQNLKPKANPFLNYDFMNALEKSQSIAHGTGWDPVYFLSQDSDPKKKGLLFTYIKSHSYGEYIFDWGWAEAYQKYRLAYYPKLTSMIPFSPVTTSHFLMPSFDENVANRLLDEFDEFYQNNPFSSSHFLFLNNKEEYNLFHEKKYLMRETLQYHFSNEDYSSFDDFLGRLKNKKARQIRKERFFPHLKIESLTGSELTDSHAREMCQFYLSTIDQKQAIGYLNLSFFQMVFASLKDHILYVRASRHDSPIAGALYFYDSHALYGRYWGCSGPCPNLHFELCYYQGIDFCIKNKIPLFEGGAQGEHKLARGFRPVTVFSAHKLKNVVFENAVGKFISQEREQIKEWVEELTGRLPFKN